MDNYAFFIGNGCFIIFFGLWIWGLTHYFLNDGWSKLFENIQQKTLNPC